MSTATLRSVLGWSSIINIGLLSWWLLMYFLAHDLMYSIHGPWFGMSVETFDTIHYAGMGLYKIAIFCFFVVPYFAVRIAEKREQPAP